MEVEATPREVLLKAMADEEPDAEDAGEGAAPAAACGSATAASKKLVL